MAIGVLFLALGLVLAPGTAVAQPAAKIPRVGVVGTVDAPPWEAFRQVLKQLGHVDGQTIALEWRFYGGVLERLPQVMSELVRAGADVIVVAGSPAALAAKQATSSVPIVALALGQDPVRVGLAASFARPGANVTGLTFSAGLEQGKRLELLREVLPRARRVAYLDQPNFTGADVALQQMQAAAQGMGVQLFVHSFTKESDFDSLFPAIARQRPDGLVVHGSSFVYARRKQIADFGLKERLPMVCPFREAVEAGCLMSYAPDFVPMFRRGAHYVDRVLKGAKPAELPIEQPSIVELVINLKTARALGMAIPASLRIRADHLIQ